MESGGSCNPCGNASGLVEIVQGYLKLFYVNLFFEDTEQPFDLTNVSGVGVTMPGANGTPVTLTLSTGVAIVGAPGAGLISVQVSEAKSALLAVNPTPGQAQDIQVEVTVGVGGNASSPAGTSGFILQAALNVKAPPYGAVIP